MATSKVKSAVKANPATTTASVGLAIAILGAAVGADSGTIETVTKVALVAVPVVRTIVYFVQKHEAKKEGF